MPTVTALPYLFPKIMKINSTFRKYGQPFKSSRFCHSWKATTTNTAFSIFPKSSRSVCAGTYRIHFWTCCSCAKDRNNADLLLEVLCACVKDTKQKKFLRSFCEAGSWIDRNQGAICENILCTTESMAESIDRAPAKLSPVKRRRFQMFKKVHHEKWSFTTVDEKGYTCMNSEVHSSVVKWLNWRTVKHDWQRVFSAARNW